jgi:hypothetical protein
LAADILAAGRKTPGGFGAGVDFVCNAREVGVFILAGIPCVTPIFTPREASP